MSTLSKETITIRPLKLGDAGWIIYRHAIAIAPEFGWGTDFEALSAKIFAEFLPVHDAPHNASWIAEHDGQILGSLLLMKESETTARLRLLYVEHEARGLGLATTLLTTALNTAKAKGYVRVILFTTGSNLAARRIYERLGMRMILEEPLLFAGKQEKGETWEIELS